MLTPVPAAFRSMTLTPLDALLAELAWLISDFERGQQGAQVTFGGDPNGAAFTIRKFIDAQSHGYGVRISCASG